MFLFNRLAGIRMTMFWLFAGRTVLLVLGAILLFSLSLQAESIDLNGPWLMRDFTLGMGIQKGVHLPDTPRPGFLIVTVPTTERAALLNAGKIPDPYVGTNNELTQWPEEKEWWFIKEFSLGVDKKGQAIDLIFEGIVYKGEVWVNGKAMGSMEGMFNPFSFPVSKILNYGGKNIIAVRLQAPDDARIRNLVNGYQYDLEAARPQNYAICQSLYCWDWAPHMVVTGIWRPVKLRVTDSLRVERPWVRTRLKPGGGAHLDILVETRNLASTGARAVLAGTIRPKNFKGESIAVSQIIQLEPQATVNVRFAVDMADARLWWPNGMGGQALYTFDVQVLAKKKISDYAATSFGIRDLKIIGNENTEDFLKSMQATVGRTTPGSNDLIDVQHLGKVVGAYPWTFQINGRKMFVKGSNWIPADQMLRLDRERYDHLLTLAQAAHFNMFRVWGGGLFETDDFYELCDEKGILNWFEFLSSSDFSGLNRTIFSQAARAALRRIRNHPSLTYYCGGNEFDPDAAGVKDLIDILAEVVQAEDPDREFHRASPYMGDDHFWAVWHRFAPYTDYRRVRPFRSEAGLNAMPVLENYRKFTPQEKLWPIDKYWLEYRGSYQINFSHLPKQNRYANEFGVSTNIADYIRRSQLAQSLADAFNIEFCRSKKFQNSGVLIWQFNDAYPCASWSLVDWYGTPKPSYYYVKRACRLVHVAADFETYLWKPGQTFKANLSLLNDMEQPQAGIKVESILLDVFGQVLDRYEVTAAVPANSSRTFFTHSWNIPVSFEGRIFMLAVRLQDAKGQFLSEILYPMAVRTTTPVVPTAEQAQDRNFNKFEHFQNIFEELQKLPRVEPRLDCKIDKGHTITVIITNPGTSVLFDARLKLAGEDDTFRASYDDNCLNLLPGESRTIIISIQPGGVLPEKIRLSLEGWNAQSCRDLVLNGSIAKKKP